MSSPIPVRFPAELDDKVSKRARAIGSPKSRVIVNAVDEWLLMQDYPRVIFVSTNTGERRACLIAGPEVWTVAEAWMQQPQDERNSTDLAELLGLAVADVEAAVTYWSDRREEIDRLIELHHETQQNALESWERRRALDSV